MDYAKYYDIKPDGSYFIHFPNNKGLSVDQIKETFAKFGKVLSVDNRGQVYGLCFVRYGNLEDTKRCINGLKNHKYIRILQHKNKGRIVNANRKPPQTKNELLEEKPLGNNSSDDSRITNSSRDDIPPLLPAESNNELSGDAMSNNGFSDTSINSPKITNLKINSDKKRPFLKHLTKYKNSQIAASSTSVSSTNTNECSKETEKVVDGNEIPPLVPMDNKVTAGDNTLLDASSKIIPAQEVIVANIHPNLSIHYILHLFEKHNPISVSLMKTTPAKGIRYCHVYYKTLEEAFATMMEFDTYCLHGRRLIVLTSQKLIQEAY